jgi:hypothetical protein
MSGLGKQLRGSGIARPGVSSTREGFKKGGSAKIGPFLQTMGEYKNLAKSKELHMKKGGSTNWIQGAIKKPGSLRKTLGVKAGQKIPAAKLAIVAKKSGITGKRARLAQTLKGLKK